MNLSSVTKNEPFLFKLPSNESGSFSIELYQDGMIYYMFDMFSLGRTLHERSPDSFLSFSPYRCGMQWEHQLTLCLPTLSSPSPGSGKKSGLVMYQNHFPISICGCISGVRSFKNLISKPFSYSMQNFNSFYPYWSQHQVNV